MRAILAPLAELGVVKMVAGGALIPRAPALVVALLINAVSVVAILAFAGSMAPAMAQESTE